MEWRALDGVEALVLCRCSIFAINGNDMSVFYSGCLKPSWTSSSGNTTNLCSIARDLRSFGIRP